MVIIKDKLMIEIVEHNSEVLPVLIRTIGKELKSDEDVALIRFDTFADLLVPKDVQADKIETLDHLADSINNHCWILPAVYRGYITKIFWFKPPWAHQFQDGKYELQVGKCQQTGVLKITSTNPYFTSNCVYLSKDKLSNIHTVDIYVCTAGLAKNYSTTVDKPHPPVYDNDSGSESLDADNQNNSNRKKPKLTTGEMNSLEMNHKDSLATRRVYPLDATLINDLLESRQFLLDIDLSFFSTDDSIRKQFDENEYEVLRYVYTRIVQDHTDVEIQRYMTARESALEQIRTLMDEYLTDPKPEQPIVIDNPYLAALIGVIRYKKLDWKSIHNYGMSLSDTRPAWHVSSEEMVIYLLESMAKILQSIKKDPVLITISRCVDDGYCSSDHADMIQRYVENKLKKLYKIDEIIGKSLSSKSSTLDDDDDDDDEMEYDDGKERKPIIHTDDDDNSHHSTNGTTTANRSATEKSSGEAPTTTTNTVDAVSKKSAGESDVVLTLPSNVATIAMNTNSLSPPVPSPPKVNTSPIELIKQTSPSSLSEASSPVLD